MLLNVSRRRHDAGGISANHARPSGHSIGDGVVGARARGTDPAQRSTYERSTGITVTVDPSGRYAIAVQDPAWTFGGEIGSPLTDLEVNQGMDNIGEFQEIAFNYTVGASPQQGTRAAAARQGAVFAPM